MDLEWKRKDEMLHGGSGCVSERQGKVYPFRKSRGVGCVDTMLRAGDLCMCTHVHMCCSHGLTVGKMLVFYQFWIFLLCLINVILLVSTKEFGVRVI